MEGVLVFFLLLALLLFYRITSFQVTENQKLILYVKRSNKSQCPADIQITECQTLDWYSAHFNASFMSNTKMLFEEGGHELKNTIVIDNCHNFIMTGSGGSGRSDDGLPQPTSKIYCKGSNTGLIILNSNNINIKNLELTLCSGQHNHSEWYHISASLIFDSVQNVSLEQVVIGSTKGHALFTKDVYDSVYVVDSAFLNSSKHPDFRQSGNARFNFTAQHSFITSLVLNSSWFMYGETSIHQWLPGGLIINIACPNIHVTLVNVTAKGNTGGLGGNIAIFLVLFNANSSNIVINNSRIMDGYALKGGGLAFRSRQNQEYTEYCNPGKNQSDNILMVSNTFYNNSATKSGGAMYMAHLNYDTIVSHLKHVTIMNCTFMEGSGTGSSVDIVQHSLQPMLPFLNTSLVLCNFTNNRLTNNDVAVVVIISDKVSLINCTFTGNNSTAIALNSAYLNLYGNILFENNTARLGGAMKINEASLVFIHNGTHVSFINNRAEERGGAIYVKTYCKDSFKSTVVCFLQPALPPLYDIMPISEFTKWMTLEFINNSAKVSGDALYGGDFDRCSTTLAYRLNNFYHHKPRYSHCKAIFKGIFDMKLQYGSSNISSDPRKVCFCNNYKKSCNLVKDPIKVYPGQTFTVSVITIGQMESSSRGRINASLLNESYPSHRLIRVRPPIQLTEGCVNLTYTLESNKRHAQLRFAPETAGVYCTIQKANLIVDFLPCPLGFKLTKTAPYKCSCDPLLSKFLTLNLQITCNISEQIISVPQKTIWFGCFNLQQNQSSLNCDSLVVTPNCDHCRNAQSNSKAVKIPLTNLDEQCSEGHTGIMCGTCKPGYSRVLGDLMNCQKGYTYTNLPILLIAFLASVILLLVLIRTLNITVTEGTINGILVYTTVMQTHHSYFSEHLSHFGRGCWVFISWRNLTLGFKACFYKGMNGYGQIWIIFGQVIVSFLFLFTIILLGQRFIFFTRLLGRNIVQVLATLVAMIYSNLLFATTVTFRSATLHISTTNGTQYSKAVWYYDGSIPDLGLKHAPLFVIALICSLFMLYFMSSLLFIQCLQKRSEIPCLRWVERLRPFYEAYTGPCRDHYRFWPGFLFLLRTALFIMNSFIPSHIGAFFQIKMLITAVSFVLIISLACISPQGIYKRWPINILEFSFYLNLCITSGFLALNYNKQKNVSVVYTSVSIAAITFFGILVYHCYSQVKSTKAWKKLSTWTSVRARFVCNHTKQPDHHSDDFKDEKCDERDQLLPQALPPVIMFDHLREPLVEA